MNDMITTANSQTLMGYLRERGGMPRFNVTNVAGPGCFSRKAGNYYLLDQEACAAV
jgi:hypothetical protein